MNAKEPTQHQRKASAAESPDSTHDDQDTRLDFWVGRRPVWTFLFVAAVSASLFVLLYWMTGEYRIGGFKLDEKVTNYVGAMGATVVALAGALVSVMLARLALKLGREAKDAALRANKIQDQMRKFSDPRLVETREGHKAGAALDLLGTLLSVYGAETFSSLPEHYPIEAIRHTYKRGNDLVSDPALYRYCAQLIGAAETANRFASMQAKIYQSNRMLDGKRGDYYRTATARNAERIAIEIAHLSRIVEQKKKLVLADEDHALHQLALDLDWQDAVNIISGCETTARSYFLDETRKMLVVSAGGEKAADGSGEIMDRRHALAVLFQPGSRSVVHVLETELDELIGEIQKVTAPDSLRMHEGLRQYAAAWNERESGTRDNVIVARWDSTLKDDPKSVAENQLDRPWVNVAASDLALESPALWEKATFLALNPVLERAINAALKDVKFLREMRVEDVSDDLYGRQGIDPEDSQSDVIAEDWRLAARSANRLRYIHAAIEELRQVHAKKGAVVLPDRNPYEGLGEGYIDGAIVVIRPYFANIDMSLPGSEWKRQNEWFENCISRYKSYRWHGEAS